MSTIIPDAQFTPDPEPSASPTPSSAGASFIPDEQFQPDEEKYGTPGQVGLGMLEAVGRGATLGGSDVLETQLGLSTPEAIKGRKENLPYGAPIASMIGGGAMLGLTGGLSGIAGRGALALGATAAESAATRAALSGLVGTTAEGALFGAGNAVSDAALGDPDALGQKLLAHVGFGAAMGFGLGALSKGIKAIPSMLGVGKAAEGVVPPEEPPPPGGPGAPPVEPPSGMPAPEAMKSYNEPVASIEEAAQRIAEGKSFGQLNTDAPQAKIGLEALSRRDMGPWKPPEVMIDSIRDPKDASNQWTLGREMSGRVGETVRGFESALKQEALGQLDQEIATLHPDESPITDLSESGPKAKDMINEAVEAKRAEIGPKFEALKAAPVGHSVNHLPVIVKALSDEVPSVGSMFDTEAGDFTVKPYDPQMGIDKPAYDAVKTIVDSVKSNNPETIENLINLRRSILPPGKLADSKQLYGLKSGMMKYIQETAENGGYSDKAINAFRDWAINETNNSSVQRLIGESKAPEKILGNIFRDSNTVNAVKTILTPKQMEEITSNYLASLKEQATKLGEFKSGEFGRNLIKRAPQLSQVLSPDKTQALNDLSNIIRIFPDKMSINTSGTSKTLVELVKNAVKNSDGIFGLGKELSGTASKFIEDKLAEIKINQALQQKGAQASQLGIIQKAANKVTKAINSGAKDILNGSVVKGAILQGSSSMTNDEYNKATKKIKDLSSKPEAMLNHLNENTDGIYSTAPNITQGIHKAFIAGVQFLDSKIPSPGDQKMLSQDWEPSRAEKYKFANYYRAVDNPLSILEDVKNDSVTPESLEALNAVHPALLQEMRQKVIENIKPEEVKKFPYASKLALSNFLGEPLDNTMTPQSILSSQITFNSASVSQQGGPKEGRKVNQGGMKQMKVAARARTETQEEREA